MASADPKYQILTLVKTLKMKNLGLYSLFLLQYFGATFAAPTSDALGPALFPEPAKFASNTSSTTKLALPDSPPFSGTIPYHIPGSTVTLRLNPCPHLPIPPSDLRPCIYDTLTRVLDHIRQDGDGPLADIDNPYRSDPLPDVKCQFSLRSWHSMTPQGTKATLITYGILHTVLSGLLEYMLFPDPHYYSMSFTVRTDERGAVGSGSVTPNR